MNKTPYAFFNKYNFWYLFFTIIGITFFQTYRLPWYIQILIIICYIGINVSGYFEGLHNAAVAVEEKKHK
jgi:hypothetical protein